MATKNFARTGTTRMPARGTERKATANKTPTTVVNAGIPGGSVGRMATNRAPTDARPARYLKGRNEGGAQVLTQRGVPGGDPDKDNSKHMPRRVGTGNEGREGGRRLGEGQSGAAEPRHPRSNDEFHALGHPKDGKY